MEQPAVAVAAEHQQVGVGGGLRQRGAWGPLYNPRVDWNRPSQFCLDGRDLDQEQDAVLIEGWRTAVEAWVRSGRELRDAVGGQEA